jgi:hypothetical protein
MEELFNNKLDNRDKLIIQFDDVDPKESNLQIIRDLQTLTPSGEDTAILTEQYTLWFFEEKPEWKHDWKNADQSWGYDWPQAHWDEYHPRSAPAIRVQTSEVVESLRYLRDDGFMSLAEGKTVERPLKMDGYAVVFDGVVKINMPMQISSACWIE